MQLIIRAEKAVHRNQPVLKLNFPYNDNLIALVRSLPGASWSRTMNSWYIPRTDRSVEGLYKLPGISIITGDGTGSADFRGGAGLVREGKKLRIIRYSRDRIRLVGVFDDEMLLIIKTIPMYFYNAESNWLTVPHTEETLELLSRFCTDKGWQLEYNDEWAEQKLQVRKSGIEYQDIDCPAGFEEKLKIQRYSDHTIKNYCSALKEFARFYKDKSLDNVQQADIEKYLL